MLTTSKIFFDSSVFVEASKGNHEEFLSALTQAKKYQGFINEIVCSETWYLFIGLNGNASPLSLKERGAIQLIISTNEKLFSFYLRYNLLPASLQIITDAHRLMQTYNLLPCRTNKINNSQ